ncbi:kinase-like protein [Auricularia subglabra TFB-10046 SS5]|nr:kinase-like protein [Auricularia subglabra TFB-10046 SS5]
MNVQMPLGNHAEGLCHLSGTTFDGVPFQVALSSSTAIDNGATAKIYRGNIVASEPLAVAVKIFGQMMGTVEQEIFQVAEAMDHLHTNEQLVHGDLKCANVLISDFGDALLADFGLSTFAEKSQTNSTTLTGIRQMHTVRFAAPELLLGSDTPSAEPGSKTRHSDVYAFGMLVLEKIRLGQA